ncbi:AT-hook motif nuclear-localized protein 1 [Turnera subulata]|uniref:AT-hook motif nuclear-localized protein n=1 Tax=Turnera subulata TaxID=218843 RepID=A0A9Q0GKU1_9ROSI|nr:AT-hook motif nuclear-localized protein 1 [Turnera subulata]
METVSGSSGGGGGGGVTVVGSDAPSDYQIAPRSENNNPSATPASAPQAPPPVAAGTMPAKKKRGRPRKYGPDGSVTMALSPKPISSAAPAPQHMPPVIDFSAVKQKKVKPVNKANKYELENLELVGCFFGLRGTCSMMLQLRDLGQVYGEDLERYLSQWMGSDLLESSVVGEWVACSVGANFTPHIITVNTGEDVTMKIISFSQQGPRAICILSANGVISSVTLRQPDSSGGTLTYEGRFEILSLSGSFMPTETGGTRSRSGGMSVSLASPDGRVVGGGVAGLLVAASPVQVVVGSFLAGNQHEQKPKKQKHDSILTTITTTAAVPISSADPKSNISFRGDSWSSLPADSRNKPADINVSLPAG